MPTVAVWVVWLFRQIAVVGQELAAVAAFPERICVGLAAGFSET